MSQQRHHVCLMSHYEDELTDHNEEGVAAIENRCRGCELGRLSDISIWKDRLRKLESTLLPSRPTSLLVERLA